MNDKGEKGRGDGYAKVRKTPREEGEGEKVRRIGLCFFFRQGRSG